MTSTTNGSTTITGAVGYVFLRTEQIASVLLADGWHEVEPQTFTTAPGLRGTLGEEIVPGEAFAFTDAPTKTWICGPLTSILAVSAALALVPRWAETAKP